MSAKRIDIGRYPVDFWEHTREAWAGLDGHHWQMRRASEPAEPDIPIEQLHSWLAEGAKRLTDRQRIYIDAYYNQGLSLALISQKYEVDKSTVSQVIRNGMARMRDWLGAKKLIALYTDQQGNYDLIHILEQLPNSLLPRRQRQLLIMKISNSTFRNIDIADILGLERSTVTRTLKQACRKLQNLGIYDEKLLTGRSDRMDCPVGVNQGAKLCPDCGEDSKVINSRVLPDGSVWRRRECLSCGKRYETIEKIFENTRCSKQKNKDGVK